MAKSDYVCCNNCNEKCVYNPDSEAIVYCQSCFEKPAAERDRYKEALEEIAKKHFPCEDEPWCIALIAQTALADPKGSTPLGTERK